MEGDFDFQTLHHFFTLGADAQLRMHRNSIWIVSWCETVLFAVRPRPCVKTRRIPRRLSRWSPTLGMRLCCCGYRVAVWHRDRGHQENITNPFLSWLQH